MKNQRDIAYEILSQNRFSNLEIQKLSQHPARSFITHLVYTVHQHYESLKFQFEDLLHTPVPNSIEVILVMAAAQKYKMDSVTDYALVNESVELAKRVNRKYANLVNAVLKKMVLREFKLSQSDDQHLDLSINSSHPLWMVKLLTAQYGLDLTTQLLHHHNTIPMIDIRVNQKKMSEDEVQELYPVFKDDDVLIADSSIFSTNALTNGYVLVQDRNSQALINNIEFKTDDLVLDACCAPGTKLTQIADQVRNVIGVDLHEHRIKLTQELVTRWGNDNVELFTSDILEYQPDSEFDKILCDVPCSGLGVMRRKPDIKRRIQPEDLDTLEHLQAQILNHVSQFVKVGGYLIYATCTLNKKENEKQIEKFLKTHPNYQLIEEETIFGSINNGDSFYKAQLLRKN